MIHVGIDHHKKFSHVVAMDDVGKIIWDGKLASTKEAFVSLKESLPEGEPVHSVLEAGWNWGVLYDALEELELHPNLANPLKVRLIAESFIKTDRIDATVHAMMLRAGITPLVHVPDKEVRDQKNLLRERFWLVRLQTAFKNRIHALLSRNHVEAPERTDLFGSHGRAWMNALSLRDPDAKLLQSDLELLDFVRSHVRQTEKWIDETLKVNANIPILMTLPGVGKTLGALMALEIDTIERFMTPEKFCSYSGLACSTYSSGGKTFHGGLIPACNRHLRYAFIEAAWTAVRVSPYFSAFFKRLKARKGSHDAIGAVGRKLCEITWHCLKKKRNYKEQPYHFKPLRTVSMPGGVVANGARGGGIAEKLSF